MEKEKQKSFMKEKIAKSFKRIRKSIPWIKKSPGIKRLAKKKGTTKEEIVYRFEKISSAESEKRAIASFDKKMNGYESVHEYLKSVLNDYQNSTYEDTIKSVKNTALNADGDLFAYIFWGIFFLSHVGLIVGLVVAVAGGPVGILIGSAIGAVVTWAVIIAALNSYAEGF